MESCTFYPIVSMLEKQDGLRTQCRQYKRLWRCCTHTASAAWLISASELQLSIDCRGESQGEGVDQEEWGRLTPQFILEEVESEVFFTET